jgi:hypothetical protein
LVLVVLAFPAVASAQGLGAVAGAVRDTSGAVLPGVTVEASSPALIEKVRSGVTDALGQYRIVNLPPGIYALTFTLTGFGTVRRDAIEVALNITSNVNAELRVGAVQETVTVTGESPIVDVQSSAQSRTVSAEAFKELPVGSSWIQMASLVPAIQASNVDVGGILGDQTGAQVRAHGSAYMDGVSMIDGLRIGNMYLSSNLTNMSLSPLLFDQVDISLAGQIAETGTNGVIMNAVPKAGGNVFSGSVLANFSDPALQGDNVTERLNARGLTNASTTLKTLYDINGAIGGPIKRDKVWFYFTSRYFTNYYYLASRYYPTDVTAVSRTNDLDRQAYGGTYTADNNGRVTWAINDKQKISGWYAYQYKVDPHWLIQINTASPEGIRITRWHTQLSTTKWTYTATNRLLFEAGIMAGESPDTIKMDPDQVGQCSNQTNAFQGTLAPVCIAIVNQSAGNFFYRAPTGFDFDDRLPSQSFNVASSYVTGSHNVKVGFEMQRGHFLRGDNNDSTGGIWYSYLIDPTTRVYGPSLVTIQSPLSGWQNNLNYNLGLFAQDRWTANRLTVSAGVRLDFLNESTEPFTAQPHRWLPNRNNSFDAVENVPNWKDINPRLSAAYDLFGNGKTALKASASRGVEQDSIRYAAANNPATTLITQAQRTWNDANGNSNPDCDLTSGAAQDLRPTGGDNCGAWVPASFGSVVPGLAYSRSIMEGWGVRPYNWEYSAGIQQEIIPRLSASFAYFHRAYGNFYVQDNEALAANQYTEFSVTAPNVPGFPVLPNAGQTVNGLYDPIVNVAPRNVVKDASQFGDQIQTFDGYDLTVDARLRNGLFLQGGVSTGKTLTDNCQIVDDVPESLQSGAVGLLPPAGIQPPMGLLPFPFFIGVWTPKDYCRQESPYLAQYKAIASYTLPWWGIRLSGTFQSIPGPLVGATNVYANPAAGGPPLGTSINRPLTNGQANVNVLNPGSMYGDRLNQFDLRFTKILDVGKGRLDLNVDIYNAFNSDAVTLELPGYGPVWRLPLTVIQPQFIKFAARWDF